MTGDGHVFEPMVRAVAIGLAMRPMGSTPRMVEADLMLGHTWETMQALQRTAWGAAGLTGLQLGMVRMLALAEGRRMTIRDLTAAMSTDQPNVTKLANRLQRLGLVQRVADAGDRRVTWVELTPLGVQRYTALQLAALRRQRDAFALLTPEELDDLVHLLCKVRMQALSTLAAGVPEPEPPPPDDDLVLPDMK